MISDVPTASSDSLPSEAAERRVRQALEIMDAEPARSADELALAVRLSPAHLQRLFKQQTGRRIGELISEKRLHKAAQLLSTTNLSVKEVGHAVGYKHPPSFVRAFQRRFGQAPGHYRNRE